MKTILFDFFGVLSTPVYKQVIDKFISETERAKWMEKLDDLDLGTLSEERLIGQISEKASVSPDAVKKAAEDAPHINTELLDFIEKELKGKYQIGLLTNIPRNILERIIPHKLMLFDIALVSSDLKLVKPNREIFEVAVERCGVPPEQMLFIDDSKKNIEVAQTLGIHGIVYTDFPSFLKALEPYLATLT